MEPAAAPARRTAPAAARAQVAFRARESAAAAPPRPAAREAPGIDAAGPAASVPGPATTAPSPDRPGFRAPRTGRALRTCPALARRRTGPRPNRRARYVARVDRVRRAWLEDHGGRASAAEHGGAVGGSAVVDAPDAVGAPLDDRVLARDEHPVPAAGRRSADERAVTVAADDDRVAVRQHVIEAVRVDADPGEAETTRRRWKAHDRLKGAERRSSRSIGPAGSAVYSQTRISCTDRSRCRGVRPVWRSRSVRISPAPGGSARSIRGVTGSSTRLAAKGATTGPARACGTSRRRSIRRSRAGADSRRSCGGPSIRTTAGWRGRSKSSRIHSLPSCGSPLSQRVAGLPSTTAASPPGLCEADRRNVEAGIPAPAGFGSGASMAGRSSNTVTGPKTEMRAMCVISPARPSITRRAVAWSGYSWPWTTT